MFPNSAADKQEKIPLVDPVDPKERHFTRTPDEIKAYEIKLKKENPLLGDLAAEKMAKQWAKGQKEEIERKFAEEPLKGITEDDIKKALKAVEGREN